MGFTSALYDSFLWLGERRGMGERRTALLRHARGRTLEIGAGTGLNLAHYPRSVDALVATEPDPAMASALTRRADGRPGVELIETGAERLPFQDGSFDTVVSTLVLCTVPDPALALAEVRRVLRPGGQLLFMEHERSRESRRLAAWQDRLHTPWRVFARGCHCNRGVLDLLRGALSVEHVDASRWHGMPRIVQPLVIGRAVAQPS